MPLNEPGNPGDDEHAHDREWRSGEGLHHLDDYKPSETASIIQRFVARLTDGVLIGIPALLFLHFAVPQQSSGSNAVSAPVWAELAVIGLVCVYEIVMIGYYGQTAGKMLTGVQVVRVATRDVPGFGTAAIRSLFPNAVAVLPGIAPILEVIIYAWALFDRPYKRGLHDKAAGTIVLRVQPRIPGMRPRDAR